MILGCHVIFKDYLITDTFHVNLQAGAHHGKSPSYQVSWSQALWQWRYHVLVAEEQDSTCSPLNNVDHSLRNYDQHNSLMSNKQLYHNLFYFYRKQYFNTSFPTYFEASLVTVETSASTVILPTTSQTSKLYLQKLLPRQQYCFHVQKNFTDRLVDKYTVSRICYILYNYVFLSRVINLDYFSLNLH